MLKGDKSSFRHAGGTFLFSWKYGHLLKSQLKTCLSSHCFLGNDTFLQLTQWHPCKNGVKSCWCVPPISIHPHNSAQLDLWEFIRKNISLEERFLKCSFIFAFQKCCFNSCIETTPLNIHMVRNLISVGGAEEGLNKSERRLLARTSSIYISSSFKRNTNNILFKSTSWKWRIKWCRCPMAKCLNG